MGFKAQITGIGDENINSVEVWENSVFVSIIESPHGNSNTKYGASQLKVISFWMNDPWSIWQDFSHLPVYENRFALLL